MVVRVEAEMKLQTIEVVMKKIAEESLTVHGMGMGVETSFHSHCPNDLDQSQPLYSGELSGEEVYSRP